MKPDSRRPSTDSDAGGPNAPLFGALRNSEEKYRWLVERLPTGVVEMDTRGRILFQNSYAQAIHGYADDELGRLHISDLFDDKSAFVDLRRRLQRADVITTENRLRRKDGRTVWVRSTVRSVRDEGGRIVRYLGIEEDISQARRQEAQRRAQQRMREAVWQMKTPEDIAGLLEQVRHSLQEAGTAYHRFGINIVGKETRCYILDGNGRWQERPPSHASDIIQQIWREGRVAYRRDLQAEDPFGERADLADLYGHAVRSVLDIPFSHGTIALNSTEADAFDDGDIAFLRHITDALSEGFRRRDDLAALARKEEQLRQSQKIETMGQLAGGVAHDFNNLITIISGYGQLLLHELSPEDPRHQSAAEITEASQRAEALVHQLLLFSRPKISELGAVNLNEAITALNRLLQRLIGEDILLSTHLDPDLPSVYSDRGQLEQVVMNLAVNARDAMPTGGRLRIATSTVELDEEVAAHHLDARPGAYAQIAVSDTGVGMDAETRQRIFEPFFSTKEQGKGTGLGLAIAYSIVQESGGHIEVSSRVGQGTTFRIHLPLSDQRQAVPPPSPDVPVGGPETILLVEDDAMVRRLTRRFLDESGYTVLEAKRGEEALSLFEDHPEPISLLLTDVIMPGMSGRDLGECLRSRHPEIKIIYMSGYTDHTIERHGLRHSDSTFLQKPFTSHALACKVRQILDTRA